MIARQQRPTFLTMYNVYLCSNGSGKKTFVVDVVSRGVCLRYREVGIGHLRKLNEQAWEVPGTYRDM